MSQQPAEKTIEYNVVIKGPNGEKVEVTVTPSDTAASMRERVIAFYSLSAYSNFHFEVDAKPSRIRLDEVTPFEEVKEIKEGVLFYLVCDQYTTTTAREHIKRTVALVSDTLPLVMLVAKKQAEDIPQSVLRFHQLLNASEEDKQPSEDMKLQETYFEKEVIEKDQLLKSEIDKPAFPIKFNLESFAKTHALLSEKKEYPIRSMQMAAYNPPTANRQLIGDLVYLRVVSLSPDHVDRHPGGQGLPHLWQHERLLREPVDRLGVQRLCQHGTPCCVRDALPSVRRHLPRLCPVVSEACAGGRSAGEVLSRGGARHAAHAGEQHGSCAALVRFGAGEWR